MSPHLHTTSTQDYCQHYDMADDASVLDVHSTQQQYEKQKKKGIDHHHGYLCKAHCEVYMFALQLKVGKALQ